MAYKKTGDGGNGGGSAPSDTDDFIFSKLIPFAGDQGFVSNQAPSPGTAPNRECWIHQGTVGSPASPFILLRTRDTCAFAFTGYGSLNLAQEIYDQPGNPCNGPTTTAFPDPGNTNNQHCAMFRGQSTSWTAHHLFSNANGDYIHAVGQLGTREFTHLLYGVLPTANRYGTFTGGEYCFANYWSKGSVDVTNPNSLNHFGLGCVGSTNAAGRPQKCGYFRAAGLTTGVEWFIPTHNHSLGASYTISKSVGDVNNSNVSVGHAILAGTHGSFGGSPQRWGASLIARATPLIPVTLACYFDYAGNASYGIIGTIPDVFFVNMGGFTAGETITIGSDSYVVFPVVNNDIVNTVDGDPYSGYMGLAYKIIA